jgi:hypothetical protein
MLVCLKLSYLPIFYRPTHCYQPPWQKKWSGWTEIPILGTWDEIYEYLLKFFLGGRKTSSGVCLSVCLCMYIVHKVLSDGWDFERRRKGHHHPSKISSIIHNPSIHLHFFHPWTHHQAHSKINIINKVKFCPYISSPLGSNR